MATRDTPSEAPAAAPRVDAVAARRALSRLARSAEAPWLHQEAARRMGERLGWIKRRPAEVLDWSGPAGASAALLAAAYPEARQSLVDEQGTPPADTGTRPWWQRWRPAASAAPRRVAADAVPRAGAELLWSNMRLHFEPDPPALIQAWHRALAPDGFLMFSTLGPGSLASLRAAYQAAGWGEPHAPFVDMHDLGDMLVAAGFADPVMDQETLTLSYADVAALLAELRALGVNAAPQRFAGLRTPRWRAKLESALMRDVGPGGRPLLEIELVYGHAFRAADTGPRVSPEAQIALDDMKLMLRKPKGRN
ncbi:MAG: biotin synthase [Burkholderiaceae bacterium]